eukprot:412717-Amphidinium_carterae.1
MGAYARNPLSTTQIPSPWPLDRCTGSWLSGCTITCAKLRKQPCTGVIRKPRLDVANLDHRMDNGTFPPVDLVWLRVEQQFDAHLACPELNDMYWSLLDATSDLEALTFHVPTEVVNVDLNFDLTPWATNYVNRIYFKRHKVPFAEEGIRAFRKPDSLL